MRLYHWNKSRHIWCIFLGLIALILMGCSGLEVPQDLMTVSIHVDSRDVFVKVQGRSTVQDALDSAQIVLGQLDRVDPSLSTVLSDGSNVSVMRGREEYYVQRMIIPFDHQEIINEALPEGDIRLSQPGVNGIREITYHRLYEDGQEVSSSIIKSTTLKESVDEIVMVGIKSSYASIKIPGRIVYLAVGNAWMMEGTTSNRKLVVSTGDLDGRIFSLSRNGKFLLFTRHSENVNSINSLWITQLDITPPKMIDLGIQNIVHFAAFDPSSTKIAYSTVDWRETPPGWQANNDLYILSISEAGDPGEPTMLIDENSGGIYGWWGNDYAWSPDGKKFLYAQPDEIGFFDVENKSMTSLYSFTPYQTSGDWAWIPPASWSPDGSIIYTISYRISDLSEGGSLNQFDLMAISLNNHSFVHLQDDVGMFSAPIPSAIYHKEDFTNSFSSVNQSQDAFSIAFTQSLYPEKSDSSGYKLINMDRDGSNRKSLFPEEGEPGFEAQDIVWSPKSKEDSTGFSIALIYNGNIWLINSKTGENQQVTGDGLTNRIDWR